MSKHYQYHHNFGHKIEGCQALMDKIEELIQVGYLRRFVQTNTRSYRSSQKKRCPPRKRKEQYTRRGREGSHHFDDDQCPAKQRRRSESLVREVINTIAGTIPLGSVGRRDGRLRRSPSLESRSLKHITGYVNTIAGGFAGGRCSSSVREKHLRAIQSVHSITTKGRPRIPPIIFTYDYFIAIDPAQDDPMVITMEIDKFAITNVFVDHDNSVDILYWKTLKKMRIP